MYFIFFYIILLNRTTNINISPELKNNICSFINTYYIERWNQFEEKDKLIKLDVLEKISSLKDILNTSVNLKDFVLNSIQSIEFYHDNVNFDNETILFYKARILKNLNLTNEVSKIQKSINNATNNLIDNLTDDFINNIENIPLLSMLCDNVDNKDKLSFISEKMLQLIKNNIDIPAVIEFYCFNIINSTSQNVETVKNIISTYPKDSNNTFTAPAQLIPTFKTLYYFINTALIENSNFDVNGKMLNDYIDSVLDKYKKEGIDYSEIYYFLNTKKYMDKNEKFKYIEDKINTLIEKVHSNDELQKENFISLYWQIKILLFLNESEAANKLEEAFTNIYEFNKTNYTDDSHLLLMELMYDEIISNIHKSADGIDFNLIGEKIFNSESDYYVRYANIYINMINSYKIEVEDSILDKIYEKLYSYKTSYGYSYSNNYKSTSLQATFEGDQIESLNLR